MAGIFTDKTRWQHFQVGFALGATCTIVTVAVAASAAEYKDKAHGGKWDWGDWGATMLGGLVGQVVQAAVVLAIVFGR